MLSKKWKKTTNNFFSTFTDSERQIATNGFNFLHSAQNGLFFASAKCFETFDKDDNIPHHSTSLVFSSNFGKTWQKCIQCNSWGIISFLELPNGIMIAGTDSELLFSEDFGKSWDKFNTKLADINALAFEPASSNLIIGTHTGCFKTNDFGNNLFSFSQGLLLKDNNSPCGIESLLYLPPDYLFASTPFGVFVSDSFKPDWRVLFLRDVECYSLKIIKRDIFIGASNGLYVFSTEQNKVTKLLDSINPIKSFVVNEQGKIAVLIGNNMIKSSEDLGNTWTMINDGLEKHSVSMLATYNNKIYAVTGTRVKPGEIYQTNF
jgi:ligand-binding sensor domain-containing protein